MPKRKSKSDSIPKGGGSWSEAPKPMRGLQRQRGVPAGEGQVRRPGRYTPGTRAMLEIRKYQKDGGHLIPKKAFWREVKSIAADIAPPGTRFSKGAMEALQAAAEAHATLVLNSKSLLIATYIQVTN
jgi:histone H3/H4